MMKKYLWRQLVLLFSILIAGGVALVNYDFTDNQSGELSSKVNQQYFGEQSSLEALNLLEVKGRAPKTNYRRNQFGDGWGKIDGCSVREVILARDLVETKVNDKCQVEEGILRDPYTGEEIVFRRGPDTSAEVQIDHVVALSDAWQKGAQQLTHDERVKLANDPLNLLAVNGSANQAKGDGDAATWLPPNKPFRCQYVARQVAVKSKYHLWVTSAEKEAIHKVLLQCEVVSK